MKSNEITRRAVLAALGTAPLTGMLRPRWAWADAPAGPPVARIEPVSETLWGETIVDPYRWMENPKDAEWEPFMRGKASTRAGCSTRSRDARRCASASPRCRATRAITVAGADRRGRVFYQMRPGGADSFKLYVRDGLGGEERLLIDPSAIKGTASTFRSTGGAPRPDGRHVAYGLSPAGSEMATAHVIEVDSGKLLPERIERTPFAAPSWLPDGSGFFYTRLAETAEARHRRSLPGYGRVPAPPGTDPKDDLMVLARGQHAAVPLEPFEIPILVADPSSDHVVALAAGGVRRENPLFTARLADVLAGKPNWRRVCDVADEVVGLRVARRRSLPAEHAGRAERARAAHLDRRTRASLRPPSSCPKARP